MKKVTQKALSLLLSFAMLFGMEQGAAVPAFADEISAVSIGGVVIADSSWYAKTDPSGKVTECTDTDDWNIHVVKDSGGTPTATMTLKNATIENPSYNAPAIKASGYDLNIVLEGTANQIGTNENSDGYAIYSSTANSVTITGEGDLTVKGNYGVYVNGSGAVTVETTGSLSIVSKGQMVSTGGSLMISAKSITVNGYEFYCGETSLTATGGNIRVTASNEQGIDTNGNKITMVAPKGAVFLSGGHYAIYTGYSGKEVDVSAKNNITITGTVYGGAVSIGSETGNVTVNGYYEAIEGAKTSVGVSASQGDINLTSGNDDYIISGSSGYTLAITAGGKLDAEGNDGIVCYGTANIKAESVRVATGTGYSFQGGALTITNPEGGNCSEVSVSGGGGGDAINAFGDVNIKGNQVMIAADASAANAINATGTGSTVSIGDAGIITGAVSVKGTENIAQGVVLVSQNGGDASGGLDLSTDTPTQSTYYKAGNGYALFTPANVGTPAKLILHNATIHNAKELSAVFGPEYDGIALPAEAVTLQVEGTNKIISYDGNGIGYGTDLTLSGDGTLTVEKTKCGISLDGFFAFADGAKVTLNSTVSTGDDSHITSTVYGKVADESTNQFNTMSLIGAVTIAKGATLTVPMGQEFFLDNTTSIANNGTIVNNGTIYLPYDYTDKQIQALNLPGSILLYDSDNDLYKAYANGSIYEYGGKVPYDLDLRTPPLEATYYKAENGYFIFTPKDENMPAALTLHDVHNQSNITLPNVPITLQLEGENETFVISAKGNVTTSGSGSLFAYRIENEDENAALTIHSGTVLNALYQTKNTQDVYINTVYGRYTTNDQYGVSVQNSSLLKLAPGAVLTLEGGGYLYFEQNSSLANMIIGAGASIVNNTFIMLTAPPHGKPTPTTEWLWPRWTAI